MQMLLKLMKRSKEVFRLFFFLSECSPDKAAL